MPNTDRTEAAERARAAADAAALEAACAVGLP